MKTASDWREAARALFAAREHVLAVGARSYGPSVSISVREPGELRAEDRSFDGIVWQARGELAAGLSLLRGKLRPGAPLLLIVERPRFPERMSRALGLSAQRVTPGLRAACGALLLAGLDAPTLISESRRALAVCGRRPTYSGPFDAFFEQPVS